MLYYYKVPLDIVTKKRKDYLLSIYLNYLPSSVQICNFTSDLLTTVQFNNFPAV